MTHPWARRPSLARRLLCRLRGFGRHRPQDPYWGRRSRWSCRCGDRGWSIGEGDWSMADPAHRARLAEQLEIAQAVADRESGWNPMPPRPRKRIEPDRQP
jgi:hypothetical protein